MSHLLSVTLAPLWLILRSTGPGQPTNPQHMFHAPGGLYPPYSDLCTSALLHKCGCYFRNEGERENARQNAAVSCLAESLIKQQKSTFVSVTMWDLVQMFSCVTSVNCGGWHHFYSYSGRTVFCNYSSICVRTSNCDVEIEENVLM